MAFWDPADDPNEAFEAWSGEVSRLAKALTLSYHSVAARLFRGGAAFTFATRIDALLLATHVSEKAVEAAIALLAGKAPRAFLPRSSPSLRSFRGAIRR